ncbi:hypothetical protein RAN96_09715 [Ornithobacterium rhinotracheale]|uniref:hypothetical protein n=1 Tax=Ornithobacterium rhinotracheale TaxID=28251 RepID=UPI0038735249
MIHFKIGDKVKVIDDNLSGTVTKVNENEITIETDFGFEMLYEPKELLPDVGLLLGIYLINKTLILFP